MPKTPKRGNIKPKNAPNDPQKPTLPVKDSSWGSDQNERGYYYDDAYGYQKFVEDEDLEEDSEDLENSDGLEE